MAKTDPFCDHLVDVLRPLGLVTYRFMFGGYGMYADGVLFAIVDDGVFMLKADAESKAPFVERGIGPFQPDPRGKMTMPYFKVPDELLDDQDELLAWARIAVEAARRMAAAKATKVGTGKKRGGKVAAG